MKQHKRQMRRARPQFMGMTLAETLVSVSIFGLILLLVFAILGKGFSAVSLANARRDADHSLVKAHFWLKRDLALASADHIKSKRVSIPGGGDAVWFLNANDPNEDDKDRKFKHNPSTGVPLWQTNVLYYLVRPSRYSEVSGGFNPALDPDTTGDFFAPHKFLIRKEINTPSDPETLLDGANIDNYITVPLNYTLSPFQGEKDVLDYKLVADKMLSFNVSIKDRSVEVNTSAVRLHEAGRSLSIGSTSLKNHPQTLARRARFLLRN